MDLSSCLDIDDRQLARFDDMYHRYRVLHDAPDRCRPMMLINTPVQGIPSRCVLIPTGAFGSRSEVIQRLLRGDWPAKRNIVVPVAAPSIEEGKSLLQSLRESMPY